MAEENIFREVEEELQRDRMVGLWKRYGPYGIAAVALFLFLLIAVVTWRNMQAAERQAASASFLAAEQALQRDEFADAARGFAAVEADAPGAYPALARLNQAAALRASGDDESAVILYDQVAGDGSAPALFRDLARLGAAMTMADGASAREIEARVGPLMDVENPFRPFALELLGFARYRMGDDAGAHDLLSQIAIDPGAPGGLAARASALIALIETRSPELREPSAAIEAEPLPAPDETEAEPIESP